MPKKLWKEDAILDGYLLASSGLRNKDIAEALGIHIDTLKLWARTHPAFKTAVCKGRRVYKGDIKGGPDFKTYVYNRLSPNMQKLWDKINECDDAKASGIKRIEALLKKRGKTARQHMFIYAWTESNFDQSNAMRKANISRETLKRWIEKEPNFAKLVDEIHWHKKNFYEAGLNTLVAFGNPMATVFANKTVNADRGFAERLKINMDARVESTMQGNISIKDLDLKPQTKKELLVALRIYKKKHADD